MYISVKVGRYGILIWMKALNPNYTDTNKIPKNIHLVTIFRPRFQDDGCGFYNADLIYNCKIKKKFVTTKR